MADKPFDPTLKTLVEIDPADWPVFLHLPPGPTDVIDADIATVSGAADKALRVRASPPYLLHLEFQSGHDSSALPRKLHLRNTLLENRHELLVHTAVILLRPEADSPKLNGEWKRAFPGRPPYVTFQYQVVRVWELPPGPLLQGGLGTLALAPISKVTERELPDIIQQMEARLRTPRLRSHAEDIWSSTFILMGLRYSQEFARRLLQGVRSMKESVTYQAIIEEGEAIGEVKGALREARKMLLRQGTVRFGAPPAKVTRSLERISDVEQLEVLGERLLRVESWEELLDQPRPRRRPKA